MAAARGVGSRRRRGVAMFVALGTFVVLFMLAFAVATLGRQELRLTANFVEGEIAFQVAEAGIEQAVFHLKSTLEANRALARAMAEVDAIDLDFPPESMAELGKLAPPGGRVEARVRGAYEPVDEVGATGRIGTIVLHSQGRYRTPQGRTAVRQLRVEVAVKGEDLGPVAPDHGLLIRDRRPLEHFVDGATADIRDLEVYGGDLYLEGGIGVELTPYLINSEFRPMGELGLLDLGYGGPLAIFNGGVNFTHSQVMEFGRGRLNRKYLNFRGFQYLLGPGPAWEKVDEQYLPQVRSVGADAYDDERINLRSAADYKRLASTVIDPRSRSNPGGDPRHTGLFRTVTFPGPLGFRSTSYPRVLPLYGYGDWRRMTRLPFSNVSRQEDMSAALRLDGVTFVRGDVFLEGFYEGVGTLVVQGNVFVGGHVEAVRPWVTGYHSFMNLVVLQDPAREGGNLGSEFKRNTGKLIYRPHHDTDWSARGLPKGRETKPVLDAAIYAQNGLETDRTSITSKFFNMTIEFNLAADLWEYGRLPNDLRINGTDPKSLFQIDPEMRRFGVSPFFVPVISGGFERWEEERPDDLPEAFFEDEFGTGDGVNGAAPGGADGTGDGDDFLES